jgi:hypothetical protein
MEFLSNHHEGENSRPALSWLYPTALLYYRTAVSCVALAEALQSVSHDHLTRLLQADWSGQTLLELAIRTLFVWEPGISSSMTPCFPNLLQRCHQKQSRCKHVPMKTQS